jgi:hypothetical protein
MIEMFNHRLSLRAKPPLIEGMGFLPSNRDHLSILDSHFDSTTVIAKGTSGKNLLRVVRWHISNLLKK